MICFRMELRMDKVARMANILRMVLVALIRKTAIM